MYQYTGGLRAGMGYCGAATIEDLQKATFVKISNAGMRESHAHDIEITKKRRIIAGDKSWLIGKMVN